MRLTQAELEKCNRALALAQTNWNSAGDAIRISQQNVATIGRQMQLAESRFRLAAAGIKKSRHTIPCALLAWLAGSIAAGWLIPK